MQNKIEFFNPAELEFPLDSRDLQAIADSLLADHSVERSEIRIVCLGREELREMKNRYFAEDAFTDVISFPLETAGDFLEGEVYISPGDILLNAEQFRTDFKNETARIIIHGILHLLGYDDLTAEDKDEMTEAEDLYLKRLRF